MQHEEISLLEDSLYADLYQRHAPGLFAYAYQQTTSREDAEDIVLDVFLSVLQNPRFPTFDETLQRNTSLARTPARALAPAVWPWPEM